MRGSCLVADVPGRFYSRYPDVQIHLPEESHSVEKQLMLSPNVDFELFWWRPQAIPWRKKPWSGKAFAISGRISHIQSMNPTFCTPGTRPRAGYPQGRYIPSYGRYFIEPVKETYR
ncbi:hypothetical protein QMP26_22170 [Enterocloster clostridioformis]|uniref:hypothetical protein n=1 Tax=Enterocloster clostridioformis TaxID=1531 RepID=UPI0025A5150F|nr:hypothetical protein [Enterocloster clostridioformis]